MTPHMPSMFFTIAGWIVMLLVTGIGAFGLVFGVWFSRNVNGHGSGDRPHHYIYLLIALVLAFLFVAVLVNRPF